MAQINKSQMEEELNHTWSKKVEELPVYKDLPRLAGRITVEGYFSKPPRTSSPQVLSRLNLPELTIREFLTKYAKSIGKDVMMVEPFIEALEKDWYFHIDSSLGLITTEKWKLYSIPDRLVQEMKAAVEKEKMRKWASDQLELKELETRTISMFKLSLDRGMDSMENIDKLEDVTVETNEKIEKNINKGIMKEVARVIVELASRLEDEETQVKIQKKLGEVLQKEKFGDLEGTVGEIFVDAVGTNSKVARVLKAIHQNIIFIAVYQLKSKVPMTSMTRDVRSREGWRVSVSFTKTVVLVTHKRREQSLATSPLDEQYWYEWELRMTFDKDVTEMLSANLKITDLQFDDNISPKKREEIKMALSFGNLIVA